MNSFKRARVILLFAVVPLSFTQFTDLRIFLSQLTDRAVLPPFVAIVTGHLKERTPVPTDITVLLEIRQAVIRILNRICLISVIRHPPYGMENLGNTVKPTIADNCGF